MLRYCINGARALRKMPLARPGSRREDGARGIVAVEFALVAPIILLLLFGMLEISYDLFAQSALDCALQEAARQIQTGQATSATSASLFTSNYLCPALKMLPCSSVYVNLKVVDAGSDYYSNGLPLSVPLNNLGQVNPAGFSYAPGAASTPGSPQLMEVQAYYIGPTLIGLLIPSLATPTQGGLAHVTMSSMAFVMEPYSNNAGA
jgi:Flp pilus assembly protein TadG